MATESEKEKLREERRRISEQKRLAQGKADRITSELSNPCIKEHEISYKCMSENNFDKDKCRDALDNYNMCKSFWISVRKYRRFRGIQPELPPPEERQKIKEDFFKKVLGNDTN